MMPKIPTYNSDPLFTRPDILLDNPIPKPLHGLNPRTLLGKDWWDKVRKTAYKLNNNCCWACGIHRSKAKYHHWLEAHESYDINYRLARMTLKEIVALCHSCHNFIHRGRLLRLLQANKISQQKYDDILHHGKIITKNLKTPEPQQSYSNWNAWHLMIDDIKFYSLFKNYLEWETYYGSNP